MKPTLEIIGIKKYFTGTKALDWDDDQKVEFHSGITYALLGENGAGKSTLSKILSGIYPMTAGEIRLNGKEYKPSNSKEARDAGIGIILQEPGLVPSLRVAENLLIGEEKTFSLWKFYQLSKLKKLGQAILNKCCPHINATTYVRDLTLEDQKMVEIARATATWPQVLLVDETSAALSKKNVDCLFDIMREAAKNGSIVLFITHRMEEVFEMCDKVVVLKDGKLVGMKDTSSTTVDELSQMMVGRTVAITGIHKHALPEDLEQKKVLLRVQNLSYQDVFHGVNFEVKQGHIVGIGGLTGSGKEAILPTIFGDLKHSTGKIEFFGKEETNPTPAKSIAAGIAYLPKEREKEGLILRHSIMANIVLASIKDLAKYRFFVNPGVYKSIGEKYSRVLNVKCNSINDLVDSLSGGNRQKVVVARWISRKSNIMLLDNPTRGIDVGSRAEIYSLIEDLVKQGVGFVMTSDDMPELLSMSDEVYVIRKGEVSKHFSLGERPEEKDVVRYMI